MMLRLINIKVSNVCISVVVFCPARQPACFLFAVFEFHVATTSVHGLEARSRLRISRLRLPFFILAPIWFFFFPLF